MHLKVKYANNGLLSMVTERNDRICGCHVGYPGACVFLIFHFPHFLFTICLKDVLKRAGHELAWREDTAGPGPSY